MKGPEQDRQSRITDALELYQWLWCHFRPAYTAKGYRTAIEGHKGFPDIVAVHPARGILLFCEVKPNGGKLSPEQIEWRDALYAVCDLDGVVSDGWAGAFGTQSFVCDSEETEAALLSLISGGRLT